MPTLQLAPEELQLLQDILEATLSDLRMEIVDTDRLEFKETLKQRKRLLLEILEKLQRVAIPACNPPESAQIQPPRPRWDG